MTATIHPIPHIATCDPYADLTSHDAFCERTALGIARRAIDTALAELERADGWAATTDTRQLFREQAHRLQDILSDLDGQSIKVDEAMQHRWGGEE